MQAMFVYVTASSRQEALSIGRAVVGERLAACANVLDGMTSIYWWERSAAGGGRSVADPEDDGAT